MKERTGKVAENFDSLWLYDPQNNSTLNVSNKLFPSTTVGGGGGGGYTISTGYNTYSYGEGYYAPGFSKEVYEEARRVDEENRRFYEQAYKKYAERNPTIIDKETAEILAESLKKALLNKKPDTGKKKESTKVSDTYGTSAKDQKEINDAVREAIAAPVKEREIAVRTAAVKALLPLAESEVGTVLTFQRAISRKADAHVYTHVAIKSSADEWFATGGSLTGSYAYTWDSLLHWMLEGEVIVSNVKVAKTFTDVTWTATAPKTETPAS